MKVSALVKMTVLMGVMTSQQAAAIIEKTLWNASMTQHAESFWQENTVFTAGYADQKVFRPAGDGYMYASFDNEHLILHNTGYFQLEYFVKDQASSEEKCMKQVIQKGEEHLVIAKNPQIWVRKC